jgi:hypothetical protein
MLQRQRNDQVLVGPGESMRVDDDAAIFHEGRYRALDFGRIVDAARRGLDAEARRGRLQRTPERLMNGRLGMHDHHDSRDVRYSLFQYLKPLAPDRAIEAGRNRWCCRPDERGSGRTHRQLDRQPQQIRPVSCSPWP